MQFDLKHVPDEVALVDAPLVRVLCQVRYSSVPELVDDDSERVLARLLEERLPVRGLVQGMVLPLPGFAASPPQAEHFRTFENPEGSWKATIAPDFVALETTHYDRRHDFLERLAPLLAAVDDVSRPPRVTRVGIRYTDRIVNPEDLPDLVNPALLGLLPELADRDIMENQVLQTLIADSETSSKIQVRSLCLPGGVGFDPSIPPVSDRSWVLDIDAYNETSRSWDVHGLLDVVEMLAKRAYQVFHWAATETFREQFSRGKAGAEQG